jgi:hypothetical protein
MLFSVSDVGPRTRALDRAFRAGDRKPLGALKIARISGARKQNPGLDRARALRDRRTPS